MSVRLLAFIALLGLAFLWVMSNMTYNLEMEAERYSEMSRQGKWAGVMP